MNKPFLLTNKIAADFAELLGSLEPEQACDMGAKDGDLLFDVTESFSIAYVNQLSDTQVFEYLNSVLTEDLDYYQARGLVVNTPSVTEVCINCGWISEVKLPTHANVLNRLALVKQIEALLKKTKKGRPTLWTRAVYSRLWSEMRQRLDAGMSEIEALNELVGEAGGEWMPPIQEKSQAHVEKSDQVDALRKHWEKMKNWPFDEAGAHLALIESKVAEIFRRGDR